MRLLVLSKRLMMPHVLTYRLEQYLTIGLEVLKQNFVLEPKSKESYYIVIFSET